MAGRRTFRILNLATSPASKVKEEEKKKQCLFHCTGSNGICHTGFLTACEQDQDGTAVRKLSKNLYDIYHCCVYSEKHLMMDRGTVRNM